MPATPLPETARPRRRGLIGCSRRRGTSAVEYALIAMLVSCGAGFAVIEFGPPVNRTLAYIERSLNVGPLSPLGPGAAPGAQGGGLPQAGKSGGKPPASGTSGGGLPSGSGPKSSSTF